MSGRWVVRKGVCPDCDQAGWVVFDGCGCVFGCRTTFSEAIFYATHKARVLTPADDITRLEQWLAVQPKPWLGDDYWGKP